MVLELVGLKNKILLLVILFILTSCSSTSAESINERHRQTVIKKVSKLYPDYEIEELDLEYIDFYSTVQPANKYNEAEYATIVVKNKDEQRTLEFKRKLLGWELEFDEPDYGVNVPDNIYFVEIKSSYVGRLVDMENYIEEHIKLGYWFIPNEEGNLYKRDREDEDWYYYVKYYDELFKTENGRVYTFNKETEEWEISDITYSFLKYFGNFTLLQEKDVKEILERYTKH